MPEALGWARESVAPTCPLHESCFLPGLLSHRRSWQKTLTIYRSSRGVCAPVCVDALGGSAGWAMASRALMICLVFRQGTLDQLWSPRWDSECAWTSGCELTSAWSCQMTWRRIPQQIPQQPSASCAGTAAGYDSIPTSRVCSKRDLVSPPEVGGELVDLAPHLSAEDREVWSNWRRVPYARRPRWTKRDEQVVRQLRVTALRRVSPGSCRAGVGI